MYQRNYLQAIKQKQALTNYGAALSLFANMLVHDDQSEFLPVLSSPVVPSVVPPVLNEPNRIGSSFSGRYPNCPSPKLFTECSVNIRLVFANN